MTNEKNLAKSLIISASIIGGSILLTGGLGILSHFIGGHKKPQPHINNTCCERRIPSEHENFKKGEKMPNHGYMKNRENAPEFKGENKDTKPENKNKQPKSFESNPNNNDQKESNSNT